MGTIVLVAAGFLAVLAAAVLLFVWARSRETASAARLDRLLAETARAREASQSVDRRFDELRRSMDDARRKSREGAWPPASRASRTTSASPTHLLEQLGERLGRLHEASQKIEKLAGDVTRLEDLLKPPKLRGTLGEMFLEQALAQVLPPAAFAIQHPLGDGRRRRRRGLHPGPAGADRQQVPARELPAGA